MQPDFDPTNDVEMAYLALLFLVIGAFMVGMLAMRRPRRTTIMIPLRSAPAATEIADGTDEGETSDE